MRGTPSAEAGAAVSAAPEAHEQAAGVSLFDRLATIRLPLIVLVVCYHNESGGRFIESLDGAPVLQQVVHLIANGLGGIRVPVFFLIAGHVFFLGHQATAAWFQGKIASRARSVLLPLLLWSMLWLLLIGVAQELPFLAPHFAGRSIWSAPVASFSALRFVQAVVGDAHQLFLYHLWFLRDLFVLVLLTPLIPLLVRLSRGWITVLLLVLWVLDAHIPFISRDALLFFVAGCQLSLLRQPIFGADRFGLAAAVAWVLFSVLGANQAPLGYKLWVLLGVVVALWLSGLVMKSAWLSSVLMRASKYSFFVFVAHEPLLTMVRRLYFNELSPQSAPALFGGYFAIIGLTIGLLVLAFKLGERVCPRVLGVMTGGRV